MKQDKECRNCTTTICTLRNLLQMNLNCGIRIQTDINLANKCGDYKNED